MKNLSPIMCILLTMSIALLVWKGIEMERHYLLSQNQLNKLISEICVTSSHEYCQRVFKSKKETNQ